MVTEKHKALAAAAIEEKEKTEAFAFPLLPSNHPSTV